MHFLTHRERRIKAARLLIFGLVAGLSFAVILHLAAAWSFARQTINVTCQGEHTSLDPFGYTSQPVEFTSRDGFILRGWYTPGTTHPEVAVVVLSGYGGDTGWSTYDALVLADAGYSTLMFEHRSCAGQQPGLGYFEVQDVLGAVDYLDMRPDIDRIGALGFSAGATALLLAAVEDERIEAVVAMGAMDDLRFDTLGRPPVKNLYWLGFREMILWMVEIQMGSRASDLSPMQVVDQISPRPVLFIYGEYEQDAGWNLNNSASNPRDIWIVPGTGHGGYHLVAPEEYTNRIAAFFDTAFEAKE